MNIGSTLASVDMSTRDDDGGRERRDEEASLQRRIADKAAQRRRVEAKEEVESAALVQRARRPAPVFRATEDAGLWTRLTAEAYEFDALLAKGLGDARRMQVDEESEEPEEPAGEAHGAATTALPENASGHVPVPASPDLLRAQDELKQIAVLIDALRNGPDGSLSEADSADTSMLVPWADNTQEDLDEPAETAPHAVPTSDTRASFMIGEDMPGRVHERVGAWLSFVEGFYADALDGREAQTLRAGIEQLRAALGSANAAQQMQERSAPGRPMPRDAALDRIPSGDDIAAGSPPGEGPISEDQWLENLAASACEALAAGVPPQELLIELAGQLSRRPAQAGDLGRTAGRGEVTHRGRGAAAAGGALQSALAPLSEALRRAAERLSPGDERKARLESLLATQGNSGSGEGESGQAGAAAQQESQAAQRGIDARHRTGSFPLAALDGL